MDPLIAHVRLTNFEIAACRRRGAQTRSMIADFERLAAELDREVRAEEDRTGVRDPRHFAYSTVAKAAALRRDNLVNSIAQLRIQLDTVSAALHAALERSRAANQPSETLAANSAGHAA
ncbi:MAG: flagellar export protein FliJ [Xanthobacteraceae bacterium]|nr:flagellar export protein FliJ [Xanthobacteraceae bacterium]